MLRLSYGSRRCAAVAHTHPLQKEEDRHDSNVRPRRLDNPVPSARRSGRGIGKGRLALYQLSYGPLSGFDFVPATASARRNSGPAMQWESRSSCMEIMSRRPMTDHEVVLYCVFPDHHLSNSARRTRRRTNVWTNKTPHLAFSAGGACPTAPETGGSDRTLPSTPSPAGPCTHLESCIHRHR